MSTPHVTGPEVAVRLGGTGVDPDMADHLAVVASEIVDVLWGYDETKYPWVLEDAGAAVPATVVETTLAMAAKLHDNALAVAGTRSITFDDVAGARNDLNSYSLIKLSLETARWRNMKGLVG